MNIDVVETLLSVVPAFLGLLYLGVKLGRAEEKILRNKEDIDKIEVMHKEDMNTLHSGLRESRQLSDDIRESLNIIITDIAVIKTRLDIGEKND